ncbi:amidohydrolase [Wohlfahrtiimonas chitiniclastica]|uniref:amidohydrolase n=1 Tax=Wohlfahrtiimonas chitiniclastica TaxID=400946 RepID=UPI0007B69A41|nr:amidohydrolase [Wohlfahrtiimonas chitiniclastica]KZX37364.1 hypothetical protein A6V30_00290 [Wohlfahrtiimonas chitiniclastica]
MIADLIVHNGTIFSADADNAIYSAMAMSEGCIVAIGDDATILALAGQTTDIINLHGQFVMPGLIDAHLHPFWGASQSLSCDLKHLILTKDEVLTRIKTYTQDYLTEHGDGWIIVRGWMQPDMLPMGSELTRADLDAIANDVPIIVFSNDCHILVCNGCALSAFKTVTLPSNAYDHGILEDGPAMQAFDEVTRYSEDYALTVARRAQKLLNAQGVTTVMDARVDEVSLKAFKALMHSNELTLRVFGAREIPAKNFPTVDDIPKAIEDVSHFMATFSRPQTATAPTTTITHIKFFIDGVMQAPLHTALLREPYQIDAHDHHGDCYYDHTLLSALLTATYPLGWHPHMHTVGDAGIDFALDVIESAHMAAPNPAVRPAFAHNELTAPDQYARYRDLNVIAAQSLQWAGMDQATHESFTELLGATRMQGFECAGQLYDHGIQVAYGSDWPIDPLDLWGHFQVGMTRTLLDDDFKHDNDRDLSILEVLRSVTIDAAYMLDSESIIGSLEVDKFADFIILNQNPLTLEPKEIHTIKPIAVYIGGKNIAI